MRSPDNLLQLEDSFRLWGEIEFKKALDYLVDEGKILGWRRTELTEERREGIQYRIVMEVHDREDQGGKIEIPFGFCMSHRKAQNKRKKLPTTISVRGQREFEGCLKPTETLANQITEKIDEYFTTLGSSE